MSNTKLIELPLTGPVKIDNGISNLILDLNNAGFLTYTCCSGLLQDHPKQKKILETSDGYIMFVYTDELWNFLCLNRNALLNFGLVVTLQLTLPSDLKQFSWDNHIRLSIRGETDSIRIEKWKRVKQLLLG